MRHSTTFGYRLMRAHGNGKIRSFIKAVYMKFGGKVYISPDLWLAR